MLFSSVSKKITKDMNLNITFTDRKLELKVLLKNNLNSCPKPSKGLIKALILTLYDGFEHLQSQTGFCFAFLTKLVNLNRFSFLVAILDFPFQLITFFTDNLGGSTLACLKAY